MSKHLKPVRSSRPSRHFDVSGITYDSIAKVKARGQLCYQQRLARQHRMNKRQLKKLRKKQAGMAGSRYGGICNVRLKSASAILIKN